MPDLLTHAHYDRLSEAAQERPDLDRLVERAEWYVTDRYRADVVGHSPTHFSSSTGVVRLRGWHDDPDRIDPDLLQRLRTVIADLVNHWTDQDLSDGIKSVSRGKESVTFQTQAERPNVPTSFFAPLARYDDRPVL
jgi:hypothetical protein